MATPHLASLGRFALRGVLDRTACKRDAAVRIGRPVFAARDRSARGRATNRRAFTRQGVAGREPHRSSTAAAPWHRGRRDADHGAGAIGARGTAAVGSADLQAIGSSARTCAATPRRRRKEAARGTGGSRRCFHRTCCPSKISNSSPLRLLRMASEPFSGRLRRVLASTTCLWRGPRPRKQRNPRACTWLDGQLRIGPGNIRTGTQQRDRRGSRGLRTTPYSAAEQRAHPYWIRGNGDRSARDTVFTPEERLAAAFQIVNPAPDPAGTPM